ncbi:imelysin family protein [Devosia sp.]|uniref:imelysin family protein n=1 Tax=Devosia sp. TaxID=1871048 RepID=UPI0035AD8EB3
MRRSLLALAAVLAALILPCAAGEGDQTQHGAGGAAAATARPTAEQVISLAIGEVIRPGFSAYAEATTGLAAAIGAACAAPSDAALLAAREAFRAAVIAWSRIELYRLGPLLENNRAEAILFWPDRKGIALRQVQAALVEQDESAADASTLAGKSVAMQGLVALELILFGNGAEALATGDAYRCRYALAIATLQQGTAAAMAAEWADPAGIAQRLLAPSESDPEYRSFREVAEELTGLLAHGVELIRDQRLLPFLGRDGEASRPKSALFWRSAMTVPSIAANFAGLAELLQRSRLAEATAAENLWVGNGAGFEFSNAARTAALVIDPVEAALADPRQKRALDYLVIVSRSLDTLLGENLAAALGLSVGFSSLDGD